MRIHGDRVPVKGDGIDDVRRLSAHARKRTQLFQRGRDLAAEFFQNVARGGQDMLRLVMIETAGIDIFLQLLLRKREHALRRVIALKQHARHLVDALVRALRGQDDRDEQLVRRAEFERGRGVGIHLLECFQDLFGSTHASDYSTTRAKKQVSNGRKRRRKVYSTRKRTYIVRPG